MAHHVCPRSNARLIERVRKIEQRTTLDTKDTKQGQGNEIDRRERASFVSVFSFRANPISTRSLYAIWFGRRLYPIPPSNWIKGKKRIVGHSIRLYIYIYPRTKQRVREEILFPPLSSFLFFVRRLRPTRGVRPGRVSLPLRCLPHRECFSVVSWNLMDIRAELYVIRRGEGRQGLFWWSICAIGREEGGHELGQDSFIRLLEFCF